MSVIDSRASLDILRFTNCRCIEILRATRSSDASRARTALHGTRADVIMLMYVCVVPPSLSVLTPFPVPCWVRTCRSCVVSFSVIFVCLQLACCEGWNSVVPAVCGAFVGGMYLVDTVSIQSVRLPKFIYRCCSVSGSYVFDHPCAWTDALNRSSNICWSDHVSV